MIGGRNAYGNGDVQHATAERQNIKQYRKTLLRERPTKTAPCDVAHKTQRAGNVLGEAIARLLQYVHLGLRLRTAARNRRFSCVSAAVTLCFVATKTRSSADADNGLDAFSGQSRSITMAVFFLRYSMSKNVVTLKSGSKVTQSH